MVQANDSRVINSTELRGNLTRGNLNKKYIDKLFQKGENFYLIM